MDKLDIFVCENFSPEFIRIVAQEGYADVNIIDYPCLCESKKNRIPAIRLLQNCADEQHQGMLLCSKHCEILNLLPPEQPFEVHAANFCCMHLASEKFIDFILGKGSYIIGSGWLNHWREHMEISGFSRDEARSFYHDFCQSLVFFDAGIDALADAKMKEVADYLQLPYEIIPFELESIQLLIKTAVLEWRLHQENQQHLKSMAEIQSQCAEYSAILDLIGKISTETSKRETIAKIKDIFVMVFGTRRFKFWNGEYDDISLPPEIKALFLNPEQSYLFFPAEGRFGIKIQQNDKIYGAVDVSDFVCPQYIEKYLNFAIEIAKISGLVLSNIESYEKLKKSEKELQYLSYHDALTGLYNRAYINEMTNEQAEKNVAAVFIFDIDKLKYVNDHFGHLEGDKLITGVAKILQDSFRESDIVARIGGDEFVAIISGDDPSLADLLQDRVKEVVAKHNGSIEQSHLQTSLSMGYAVRGSRGESMETLMQQADMAMYAHKISQHGSRRVE